MINKVMLIGNLGRDPEVRMTQSGKKVANFSIATTRVWYVEATKEKKEETEWHNIVAWERRAKLAEDYLKKGMKVYVEGRLQTRKWEKEGVTRWTTEIVAEQILMLGKKGDYEEMDKPVVDEVKPPDDDDIPF